MSRPRVLIVGDGNFSFSLAYCEKFKNEDVVATSFDSRHSLIEKYPEAHFILVRLERMATVRHEIDGCNLSCDERLENEKFDKIIFNHPHCGVEDIQRHQMLLSHFFASAKQCLQSSQSEIQLTLAMDQPERWEMHERATKLGLHLKRSNTFHDHEYVGYERKRHQNGKSFHRVLLHGQKLEQSSREFVYTMTPPKITVVPIALEQGVDDTQEKWRCCNKSFHTVQGFRTHVHMVHELGHGGGSQKKLKCHSCDRDFKNQQALDQHCVAKHGQDDIIVPDWSSKKRPLRDVTTLQVCQVCGFDIGSPAEHLKMVQPEDLIVSKCTTCHKSFGTDRDRRQHENYCRLKRNG